MTFTAMNTTIQQRDESPDLNDHQGLDNGEPYQPKSNYKPSGALQVRFAPHTCAAIILVLNLAFYAMAAPIVRIFELSVCREYYFVHNPSMVGGDGFVEEKFCKVDEIQKVAWLLTINGMLGFCCGKICYIVLRVGVGD